MLKRAAVIILSFFIMGADYLGRAQIEKTQNFMGASFRITVFESDLTRDNLSRVLEDTFKMIGGLERNLSGVDETGTVARINRVPQGEIVKVDDETLFVLNHALETSQRSEGAFDVTDAPLKKLWQEAKLKGELPAAGAVKSDAAGWTKVTPETVAEVTKSAAR